MKRILLGALCAVTSLALLAGCTSTTAAPGGSGGASSGGGVSSGGASGPIATLPDPGDRAIPAQVTADWTEDAVSDAWDTVPAAREDGAAGVAFTSDSTVKDFRVLAMETRLAEDGTPSYTLGEPLYAAAELPQGTVLVAELAFMGVLPDRALCYRDTDGTERCFALLVSGEDGSLLMQDISGEVN